MQASKSKYCIEKNLIDFYLTWQHHKTVRFYKDTSFYSIKNTEQDLPNFVFLKESKEIRFADKLDQLKKIFADSDKGDYLLLNHETTTNNNKLLNTEGFIPVKIWKGMFLEKSKEFTLSTQNDFEIVTFIDTTRLKDWVELANKVFYKNKVLSKSLFLEKLSDKRFGFYAGYYKGKIVATALSFDNSESTGLYYIATDPDFRGKGYASLLVKKLLNDSIKQGNSNFVLHATKKAIPVYQRLGFEDYQALIIFVLNQK